jgi:hypothetical protein
MAKKISQLNAATELQGPETFAVVQSNETKKGTISQVINYIHATNITVSSGDTVDLDDAAYDDTRLIKLTWSGASGNMTMTLPDATTSKNTNRLIRFVTNGGFNTNTRVNLTPLAGQELDGSSSSYELNVAYEGLMLWSSGTEWIIIQKKG